MSVECKRTWGEPVGRGRFVENSVRVPFPPTRSRSKLVAVRRFLLEQLEPGAVALGEAGVVGGELEGAGQPADGPGVVAGLGARGGQGVEAKVVAVGGQLAG